MIAVLWALSISLNASGSFRVASWPDAPKEVARLADVFIVQVDSPSANDLPPLLGSYSVEGDGVTFTPRYTLQPGLTYKVTVKQAGLPAVVQRFTIPDTTAQTASQVEQIYPTAAVLPENLLKFYIHFSRPMRRGDAYRHIRLLDERGEAVALPFLELNQELWDPGTRRFTLYFDPGRIKSGVLPHEQQGLAIREGHTYTLVIDAGWRDSGGRPLQNEYRKRFTVGSGVRTAIDPESWKLSPPRAATKQPLAVEFPRPLDHALLEHEIEVIDSGGTLVDGKIEIDRGEMQLRLLPSRAWIPGNYSLVVGTDLADLAGNSINRPFEVDRFDELQKVQDEHSDPIRNARLVPFVVTSK